MPVSAEGPHAAPWARQAGAVIARLPALFMPVATRDPVAAGFFLV
jgi:hypothetical protein